MPDQPELRQRLIDALRRQFGEFAIGTCHGPADRIVDHLLALPGIAIVDVNDEATIDRVHKAIWDENGRNYDESGYPIHLGVVERHRNMAKAALDVLAV